MALKRLSPEQIKSCMALKRLSPEQIKSYQRDGFIIIKGLLSQNVIQEVSTAYDDLFTRKAEANRDAMEAKWGGDWEGKEGDKSVLSVHNLQQHNAAFTRLLLNQDLLDSLEDIVGPNIVLHHTKAHLKPPQDGAPFPTHQDYHYFPYRDDSMVAVFVHLDDTEPANGGLGVFPQSHKLGPQEDHSNNERYHYMDQSKWPLSSATPVSAKAGDVLIFSYLTVHGSYCNTSDRPRRMFLLQVASADDSPISSLHRSPGSGMLLRGENKLLPIQRRQDNIAE